MEHARLRHGDADELGHGLDGRRRRAVERAPHPLTAGAAGPIGHGPGDAASGRRHLVLHVRVRGGGQVQLLAAVIEDHGWIAVVLLVEEVAHDEPLAQERRPCASIAAGPGLASLACAAARTTDLYDLEAVEPRDRVAAREREQTKERTGAHYPSVEPQASSVNLRYDCPP